MNARFVPRVQDRVDERSAQSGIAERIGGERVELSQTKKLLRVELIRIAQKPIERGCADRDAAQIGRRVRFGPRVSLRHRRRGAVE